jgi:rare lipoprotein A
MPMRRTIGISLACLVTSACAISKTPEESGSSYSGETTVPRHENVEVATRKRSGFVAAADECGGAVGRSQFGKAAWYNLVGNHTANGEILDTVTATAAHRSLPLASFARVTNLDNGRSVIVKINDRGPFTRGRILDLSPRAADVLDMKRAGVVDVVLEPFALQPVVSIEAFQTSDASMAQ